MKQKIVALHCHTHTRHSFDISCTHSLTRGIEGKKYERPNERLKIILNLLFFSTWHSSNKKVKKSRTVANLLLEGGRLDFPFPSSPSEQSGKDQMLTLVARRRVRRPWSPFPKSASKQERKESEKERERADFSEVKWRGWRRRCCRLPPPPRRRRRRLRPLPRREDTYERTYPQ